VNICIADSTTDHPLGQCDQAAGGDGKLFQYFTAIHDS
jgi:hypothetical protein